MYFEQPGQVNTAKTIEMAITRARELGITEIIVPTGTGATALQALDVADGLQVVAVTFHTGFFAPFENPMAAETRAELNARGALCVTGSHAFSGIERSVKAKYSGIYPVMLMGDTLKLFGEGAKVAVEVTVMAADAGVLSGKRVVAMGGSSQGVDTALVLTPAHQNNFFDLKIHEVVCKPFDF